MDHVVFCINSFLNKNLNVLCILKYQLHNQWENQSFEDGLNGLKLIVLYTIYNFHKETI